MPWPNRTWPGRTPRLLAFLLHLLLAALGTARLAQRLGAGRIGSHAAAAFFDGHPRYRQRFRQAPKLLRQANFSARFQLADVIYSGIDGPSAIVVGTSLQVAASLGATASLPIGDTLRVGVLLDVGNTPGLGLTIGNGLQTIISDCQQGNCQASEGSIFSPHRARTVQPALAANWAPWRRLGPTANASYVSVTQDRSGETFTGEAVSLAGAADFDFLAMSKVPVGLQLAFSWTAPVGGSVLQHVTDLGGGIFYTGSQHLALGLQLVSRRFAVQPTVDVSWSTFLSTIGLRYYW